MVIFTKATLSKHWTPTFQTSDLLRPSLPHPVLDSTLLGQVTLTFLLYLRAQVDREEVLGNESLVPQVVKDGCGPRGGDAGEGQTQDAVEGRVVQEGAGLRLAQAEDLVGVGDSSNLGGGDQVVRDRLVWTEPSAVASPGPKPSRFILRGTRESGCKAGRGTVPRDACYSARGNHCS